MADESVKEIRQLPQNIEAERAVLGSILIDNQLIATVSQYLKAEHFYDAGHRGIFKAIRDLEADGHSIDPTTLAEALARAGNLDIAGGPSYLALLETSVLSTANVASHAKIVRDKALKRQMIQSLERISGRVYAEDGSAEDLLTRAQQEIFTIQSEQVGQSIQPMSVTIQEVLDQVDDRRDYHHPLTGLASGFKELDEITSGFQNSDLIVLAGRTSMGKTAFALNLAAHAAVKQRKPVLFYSLEMSRHQLSQRILSIVSGVGLTKIRAPRLLTDEEYDRLHQFAPQVAGAPLLIDDTPGIDIADIRTRARHHKSQDQDLSMIIVDYLQLVTDSSTKGSDSRQVEVARISGTLKGVAREINVPLIALAQLSRQVEQRRGKDKTPILSDLRESGAIEQDADLVVFVHRPDFYQSADDQDAEKNNDLSQAQILVRKHRNGRVGEIDLFFVKPIQRFMEIEQSNPPH